MPTYVYECKECGKQFEADQRITEDPLQDCTLCGKKGSLRRLIQPIAVMFKGSGFYINDYAKSDGKTGSDVPPAGGKSDSSSSSESEKSSAPKAASESPAAPAAAPAPAETASNSSEAKPAK